MIPGFGETKLTEKCKILRTNIHRLFEEVFLYNTILHETKNLENSENPQKLQKLQIFVHIRLYTLDVEDSFREMIRNLEKDYGISIHLCVQEGHLGTYIRESLTPSFVRDYNHDLHEIHDGGGEKEEKGKKGEMDGVVLLLDDVELLPSFSIVTLFETLQYHNLDVLSPTLHSTSASAHRFMMQKGDDKKNRLRLTNFAELFCLAFSIQGYEIYHSLIPSFTKYMWGIDMIMYPYGNMKIGILSGMYVRHYFSSKLEHSPEYKRMEAELRTLSKMYPNNLKFKFSQVSPPVPHSPCLP